MSSEAHNAQDLELELAWLVYVLERRIAAHFGDDPEEFRLSDLPAPPLAQVGAWSAFVMAHQLTIEERLVLLIALVPHVRPSLLDVLWTRNETTGRGYAEVGGHQSPTHGGFLPTGETAAFLVAGTDLAARFALLRLFEGEHLLARQGVLALGAVSPGEPALSGALQLSQEFVTQVTTGAVERPAFSPDFPARRIETALDWSDLVLPGSVLDQLDEIRMWVEHGGALLDDWGLRKRARPGFTALFHGAPGTGKTMAAALVGKRCGADVYHIDLSAVVSKYIGETEKNLARVFERAQHRRWILFFDEADALFGRRTRTNDSHDRYANQEVSFLLQRVESHAGVVILASNMKSNIDDAFLRRFEAVVAFPMPRAPERERIWRAALPAVATLDPGLDLAKLAARFEVSGGTIINVVRYASLRALARGETTLRQEDVEEGIRRELLKEGRSL